MRWCCRFVKPQLGDTNSQVPLWRMARMSWFIAWQVRIAQVPQVRLGGWVGWDGYGVTVEVWWRSAYDRCFLNQSFAIISLLRRFQVAFVWCTLLSWMPKKPCQLCLGRNISGWSGLGQGQQHQRISRLFSTVHMGFPCSRPRDEISERQTITSGWTIVWLTHMKRITADAPKVGKYAYSRLI